ncbi:hypothetical protein H6775_03695 [Candidatus Nomurabacteria bacterium]|nr:hypothetical protein [Candidatus Nomurabacteria bacterium]
MMNFIQVVLSFLSLLCIIWLNVALKSKTEELKKAKKENDELLLKIELLELENGLLNEENAIPSPYPIVNPSFYPDYRNSFGGFPLDQTGFKK